MLINAQKPIFTKTHIRAKRGRQEAAEAMKLADCDDGRVLFRVRSLGETRHGHDTTTITSAARFNRLFQGV